MQYKAEFAVWSEIPYRTHKCNVISMQSLILYLVVRKVTARV